MERVKARAYLDAFIEQTARQKPAEPAAENDPALQSIWNYLPTVRKSRVAQPLTGSRVMQLAVGRQVLAYFEARDQVWLAALGDNGLVLERLPVSASQLHSKVGDFIADLENIDAAKHLGAALLPEAALPASGVTIHVIADGKLGRLPFAALIRHGVRLVERHPLTYLPSISAIAALESTGPWATRRPVVLGDPTGDLPAAAEELERVAALLDVPRLVRADANTAALQSATESSLLHVATHTGLGPQGPWLLLADRKVYVDDVLRWHLNARQVVLASCASGARPGRDLWGSLAAGFLAAGSRNVLAALWSVKDTSTEAMISRFYAQGGQRFPVHALAKAQVALHAQGRPVHEWAPFVVVGLPTLAVGEKPRRPTNADSTWQDGRK